MNPLRFVPARSSLRAAVGLPCVAVIVAFSPLLIAQNRLYIEEHTVNPGDTGVSVPILLDSDQDLYGFSLSLVTDPLKIRFDAIDLEGTAAASADFRGGSALEDGARLSWGVILDVTEPFDVNKVIAPGSGILLANVVFDVDPAATGTATIEFRDFPADFISNPPDPGSKNKLTLENGEPLAHTQSNGTIRIGGVGGEVGPFLRGDCNQDGESRGSPTDGIFLLTFLFIGGAAPDCLAACDMDGSGAVEGSPTDALYFFNFNFLGGPPIPPPASCGTSALAADLALGCVNPRGCP